MRLEVLKFAADWCGTCRLVDPILERVVNGLDGVELRRVNVETEKSLTEEFEVKSLPTLIMRSPDGRVLGRMVGWMTGKTIEAALQAALAQSLT